MLYNIIMSEKNQNTQLNEDTNWTFNASDDTESYVGSEMGQASGVPMPEIPEVKWSAS